MFQVHEETNNKTSSVTFVGNPAPDHSPCPTMVMASSTAFESSTAYECVAQSGLMAIHNNPTPGTTWSDLYVGPYLARDWRPSTVPLSREGEAFGAERRSVSFVPFLGLVKAAWAATSEFHS